jgi:hypothetical protein
MKHINLKIFRLIHVLIFCFFFVACKEKTTGYVSPNKTTPVTPVIEKAYAAGIPVVLVDRKIKSCYSPKTNYCVPFIIHNRIKHFGSNL